MVLCRSAIRGGSVPIDGPLFASGLFYEGLPTGSVGASV